ncbi:MAG: hypothetical protein ILA30_02700 [Selenomonas sp.]|nr:hypothetical protein [Selenomonas sp.]
MKNSLTKGMVLTWLLALVMVVSSTVADAAIHFTDKSGDTYILDYNDKSDKGKYIVKTSGGSEYFTFDYNSNTHEFTMYDNGELYAVRKFRGRNTLVCKEYGSGMPDGVYDKGNDGDYYHEIMKRYIYDTTPKAFLCFLQANGNLGNNKLITVEISGDAKAMARQGVADVLVLLVNNSDRRYYFEYIDFTLTLKDSNGNPVGTFTKREYLNGNLPAHSTVNRNIHFEDSEIPALENTPYTLKHSIHGKWN